MVAQSRVPANISLLLQTSNTKTPPRNLTRRRPVCYQHQSHWLYTPGPLYHSVKHLYRGTFVSRMTSGPKSASHQLGKSTLIDRTQGFRLILNHPHWAVSSVHSTLINDHDEANIPIHFPVPGMDFHHPCQPMPAAHSWYSLSSDNFTIFHTRRRLLGTRKPVPSITTIAFI